MIQTFRTPGNEVQPLAQKANISTNLYHSLENSVLSILVTLPVGDGGKYAYIYQQRGEREKKLVSVRENSRSLLQIQFPHFCCV